MTRVSALVVAGLALSTAPSPAAAQDTMNDTARIAVPSVFFQIRGIYQDQVFSTVLQRARVTLGGRLAPTVSYHLQAGYEETAGLLILDAVIRWKPGPVTVSVGQFKTPFAREYVIPLTQLETLDRSYAVDQFAPRRDIGIMGEFGLGPDSLAVAIVNGEGQNAIVNRDSALLVVSRLVAHPAKIIALGADVAYYGRDSVRFAADANFELPAFALRGTYLAQHRSNIAQNDFGWTALVSCRIHRGVQLVAREEDFQRPGISSALRTLTTIGGANVDLSGDNLRLGVNYISRRVGTPGVRTNMLMAQLQARL
jgi:hypothetical protein